MNIVPFTANMKRKAIAVRAATELSSRAAAEALLRDTLPVTPYDQGPLRESGRVVMHAPGAYSVQFGGPDAPYAYIVHEDLEAYHESPTKAKYLEGTYLEHKSEYTAGIIGAAKGAMHT